MFVNGSITLSSLQKKEKCEKNHILGKFAWAEFLIFKTASGHSFEFYGKYLPLPILGLDNEYASMNLK